MSAVPELVRTLTRRGVTLEARSGKLIVTAAKGVLTAEVKARLAEHKAAVLELLATTGSGETTTAAPDRDREQPQQADRIALPIPADARGISWAAWKAQTLNQLLLEFGVSRKRGRLTAATVEHGLRKERARGRKECRG